MSKNRASRKTTGTARAAAAQEGPRLMMAIELAKKSWKLAFHDGAPGRQARIVCVPGDDFDAVGKEIERARERFGLPADAPVYSCYEAGLHAFWVHRVLVERGIENVVVDPASLDVKRKGRRAKTDRIDSARLVLSLVRHCGGEKKVWSVVRVPSIDDEDARHLQRGMEQLKAEQRKVADRIRKLLWTQGVEVAVNRKFRERVEEVRTPGKAKAALPPGLAQRVLMEFERWELVTQQIKTLEQERKRQLEESKEQRAEIARRLMDLRAIGPNGGWVLSTEFFAWRGFNKPGEVGGAAGLTPTPYNTGESEREQGISKAGNRFVRTLAVELAWCWLRYQPDSKLTRWFNERFGGSGKRHRRVGIVALARKLLVALWRYVKEGVVPEGARMKGVVPLH